MSNDPSAVLVRIEQNTAAVLTWMKYLVGAVVVLILLTALLYV